MKRLGLETYIPGMYVARASVAELYTDHCFPCKMQEGCSDDTDNRSYSIVYATANHRQTETDSYLLELSVDRTRSRRVKRIELGLN